MTGSLDPDLDAALEAARAALRDDPRGHIEYPARLAIRRALAAEGDRAVGAWAFAEMSAADSVLPRWSEWRHRGDNPAQDVVDAARQVLAGDRTQRAPLESALFRLDTAIEAANDAINAAGHGDVKAAFLPTIAAWSLRAAGFAVLGADEIVEDAVSDLGLDPWEWDACLAASIVTAGGATWDDEGDPRRRRAFWTWYLTVAVPGARHRRLVAPDNRREVHP